MTDKEKLDKLVAEIEKLYVYWDGVMQSSAATEAVARKNQCRELLSFYNFMQGEPKFKIGDKIKKGDIVDTILDIDNTHYYLNGTTIFPIKDQEQWELVDEHFDEMLDPNIQYASREIGIQAHAETYSFNIESKLFNQLTKEQQALWRKEIEQACISGGYCGLELANDKRYDKEDSNEIDKYICGKEPELVDEDDLPIKKAVNEEEYNITGIKSKHATGKLKECIENLRKQKHVSNTLEEEIKQYCIHHGYLDSVEDIGYTYNEQVGDIARYFVKWQNKQNIKSFELLKEWFEDIAEKCEHLTSGNVSHNGKMIRGFAKNCAEYIETDLL